MSDPHIATIASLVMAVIVASMFSKLMRGALLIAAVGALFWFAQGGSDPEQGLSIFMGLFDQMRTQIASVLDIDSALAILRNMLSG